MLINLSHGLKWPDKLLSVASGGSIGANLFAH